MPDPSINSKVRINVPNRSGFDKSFHNLLTAPVGTLVPLMCDELIPGSKVNLKLALSAAIPPLASDTFMKCQIKAEAFFVPYRILYGGYEAWLTGDKPLIQGGTAGSVLLPRVRMQVPQTASIWLSPGTLADYLGIKLSSADCQYIDAAASVDARFNIFPFLAYHKIYDDWYRNSLIQKRVFGRRATGATTNIALSALPQSIQSQQVNLDFSLDATFDDGVELGALRQRNFGADYFTVATPSAQIGNPQKLTLTVSGGSTEFSIADLRAANSIQQFLERSNIAGYRLVDYVKDHYGANLSDGVAQRPLFLGHTVIDVYSKGVDTTAYTDSATTTAEMNSPFAGVPGSQSGRAFAIGNGTLVDHFEANEPGCLFVMVSLVPKVTYGSGVIRQMLHYSNVGSNNPRDLRADMANPLLQTAGPQPILVGELNGVDAIFQPTSVFGYTDRYADYMQRDDELHGLLRDGESLDVFALQRTFVNGQAAINTSFLQIPKTYLDQIAASDYSISDYGVWIDSYLDYKVSMPLSRYCIPSLQDPSYEHGYSLDVRKGGTRID